MGSTPLESLLLERIAERGAMPFAAFMQMALYHPRFGYYSRPEPRTDWSGHFVTSSEVDPAYGELWAHGFEEIWTACDSPPGFEVIEIGPGEGGFAEAVLATADGPFGRAVHYRMVERNPHAKERQRARLQRWSNVEWKDSVVDLHEAEAGIVFANEVLDNLPVHLVEKRDDVLWEVCVTAEADRLHLTLLPPSSPELQRFLQRSEVDLPEGHRIEVSLAAESLVARMASVLGRGALVLVDYGAEAPALCLRPDGSLVSYSTDGADDDVLALPGDKDITSHVNWTAVRNAGEAAGLGMIGPRPQRQVLQSLGLSEMDRKLASRHRREVADGRGAAAVGTLSRRHALRVLADEGGLGGLGVLAGFAQIEPPPFLG